MLLVRLVSFCVLLVSLPGFAANLPQFREAFVGDEKASIMTGLSRSRVQKIREGLGTQNIEIKGWDRSWELVNNRDNRVSSSSFMKRFTRTTQIALRDFDRYEAPVVFNPHDTEEERQGRYEAAATQKVKEALEQIISTKSDENPNGGQQTPTSFSSKLDAFVFEYHEQVVLQDRGGDLSCEDLPETVKLGKPEVRQSHAPMAAVITNHLSSADPGSAEQNSKRILDVLGHVRRLDVGDGAVKRLKMTTCIKAPFGADVSLLDTAETTLSLGILVNIVTGLDKYYVESQKYIINLMELEVKPLLEQAESYRGWGSALMGKDAKARMNIYLAVIDHMKAKYNGAKSIHEQLMSLSTEQQKVILDMFLQLKGDDIPTAEDIVEFSKWTETLPQDVAPEKLPEETKQRFADIEYYTGLETDIGFLESHLQEEQDNQRAVRQAIEVLREGRN